MASAFEPTVMRRASEHVNEPSNYQSTELRRLLNDAPTTCFSADGINRGVSLRVLDIHEASGDEPLRCEEELCESTEDMNEVVFSADAPKPRMRIISIHSKRTVQPLQISASLMLRLLAHYEVAPEFVPIIYSFGEDPDPAESGNSSVYVQPGVDGAKKLSYEIRYMEDNQRNQDRWSRRHTGVYHHHGANFDLFILLQSTSRSTAEERLCDLADGSDDAAAEMRMLCSNPFRLHLLLAASYFPNWRWYIKSIAREFNQMNDLAMTFHPEDPAVTFSMVQKLRNIQDKVLSTGASCQGDLDVLQGLQGLGEGGLESLYGIPSQIKQLEGFIASTEVLQSRVRNTIDLIGYTLDRHTQLETANVYNELTGFTEQLRDLSQVSVDNSATVTIITLVSAFYLPGSFVATLYGMNFFVFNTQENRIRIAEDFWKFVLTWIPLTIITGALYIVAKMQSKKRGRQPGGTWAMFGLSRHEHADRMESKTAAAARRLREIRLEMNREKEPFKMPASV